MAILMVDYKDELFFVLLIYTYQIILPVEYHTSLFFTLIYHTV
jgi:hypothetical protein